MQTCSNNATRLTTTDDDVVELFFRSHVDGRDGGMYGKIRKRKGNLFL